MILLVIILSRKDRFECQLFINSENNNPKEHFITKILFYPKGVGTKHKTKIIRQTQPINFSFFPNGFSIP